MTPEVITALSQGGSAVLVIAVVSIFLNYMEKADKRNQEFIKEQRLMSNEAIARLAEEIKAINTNVILTKELLIKHETNVESRLPNTGQLRAQP